MKVIRLDDQTGELGFILPDNIVSELSLKEGDDVELVEGPNRTLIIKRADGIQNASAKGGST